MATRRSGPRPRGSHAIVRLDSRTWCLHALFVRPTFSPKTDDGECQDLLPRKGGNAFFLAMPALWTLPSTWLLALPRCNSPRRQRQALQGAFVRLGRVVWSNRGSRGRPGSVSSLALLDGIEKGGIERRGAWQ
ncbi:hypothetical protein GQ53DRAFT_445546 [Thozetella sp. PMI_491]|nr:hypothetical protein GQ53DRAFT_445546 [Thozetella sp. PMI_491]